MCLRTPLVFDYQQNFKVLSKERLKNLDDIKTEK